MEVFQGRSIQGQIAYGRLRFVVRPKSEMPRYSQLTWQEELDRVKQAKKQTMDILSGYYDRARRDVGGDIASVFSIHALMLEDKGLTDAITEQLREQHATAEYAVRTAGHSLVTCFRAMQDPYMQARAADIRDVCRQMLRILTNNPVFEPFNGTPAILVADEILPSEVMDLNQRRKLLGFISRKGSVNSHSAMLLDAYHIPAMAKVDLAPSWDGHLALLDGFAGKLYLDPDPALQEALRLRYEDGGRPLAPSPTV